MKLVPGSNSSLDKLNPKYLKTLNSDQLKDLAQQLRQKIIEVCLTNGGHLGASLGAVEIAIALHFKFDAPKDKIIWDIGHQAYAHKMITDRALKIQTLRQTDGISGFLSRKESPFDHFGAGHSSTSISASLGIHVGANMQDYTIAVIGDGALANGLAHEALEQIRDLKLKKWILLINDNEMSISPAKGATSHCLKNLSEAQKYFDCLGVRYLGPCDGNHLEDLFSVIDGAKILSLEQPICIHVKTQKGFGYLPALQNPEKMHGISAKINESELPFTFFGKQAAKALQELASHNKKIIAITAGMTSGTGLTDFSRLYSDRFYDVGIAEGHALTFSAGLACQGLYPFVFIYSTFLQRAYDNFVHDIALQQLPVTLLLDRSGLVGGDGPTHHGLYDYPILKVIPQVQIWSPLTPASLGPLLKNRVDQISHNQNPMIIRYPREGIPTNLDQIYQGTHIALCTSKTPKLALVGIGPKALEIAEICNKIDPNGNDITVFGLQQIHPLPEDLIKVLLAFEKVLTLEDSSFEGGVGQTISLQLIQLNPKIKIQNLGWPRTWIEQGQTPDLVKKYHLDIDSLTQRIGKWLESKQ